MNHISTLRPSISIFQPLILGRFSIKIFWILFGILIAALLVFYIYQVNAMVYERYLIQKYENQLNKISNENKNLEINSSKLNSLENIEVLVKNLGFERVEKIHYIRVLESQVVSK